MFYMLEAAGENEERGRRRQWMRKSAKEGVGKDQKEQQKDAIVVARSDVQFELAMNCIGRGMRRVERCE